MFNFLKVGEAISTHKIYYIHGQACYLSAGRVKDYDGRPELQVIISFNKPEDALETYRRRWQIETMFKALKSGGGNLEDTHLVDLERVQKLLCL